VRLEARGANTVARTISSPSSQRITVDLVDDGVGDEHRRVEVRRRGGVAVGHVGEQRRADRAVVQAALELEVGRVVAAHEADLHEPAAERRLGLHDAAGRLGRAASGFSHSTGLPPAGRRA
jgi:hypothetical protein